MSRKNFLFLFLLVLVLPLVLTACKPVEQPQERMIVESASEPDILSTELSELAGTTVTFWHVWGTGATGKTIAAIVNSFNRTNLWGIKVEAVGHRNHNEADKAMNAAIRSGNVPNAIMANLSVIAGWDHAGLIVDLQPYVDDPVVGFSAEDLADFYAGVFAGGVSADGTRIALPLSQSANLLFYNKTWAVELGFDRPPATAAELKAQACAAAYANMVDYDSKNDGTGGLVWHSNASNIFSFLFAFGNSGLTEDSTEYNFTSQAAQDVATLIKGMWDEGCAFSTQSYPNPEFATRQALFIMSSTVGLPYQLAAFEKASSADEWGYIPFVGPNGEMAINAFGHYVTMVDTTPVQNLATWLFFKYLISNETQATWIKASASYPLRMSTNDLLSDYATANPEWSTGLALLRYGQSEPAKASLASVQRIVQDYFDLIILGDAADTMMYLEELDAATAELVAEIDR